MAKLHGMVHWFQGFSLFLSNEVEPQSCNNERWRRKYTRGFSPSLLLFGSSFSPLCSLISFETKSLGPEYKWGGRQIFSWDFHCKSPLTVFCSVLSSSTYRRLQALKPHIHHLSVRVTNLLNLKVMVAYFFSENVVTWPYMSPFPW